MYENFSCYFRGFEDSLRQLSRLFTPPCVAVVAHVMYVQAFLITAPVQQIDYLHGINATIFRAILTIRRQVVTEKLAKR